ncbi:MAG: signal peptide peptidase SppA [Blastopirellula sp.]|nr:signal peptide peptidase SppA [Blastopirellula sp.]
MPPRRANVASREDQAVPPETTSNDTTTPTQTIVLQSTGGRLWRLLFWAGWIAFVVAAVVVYGQYQLQQEYFNTTGGITEHFHSGATDGKQKIAIIHITGVIADGDGYVKQQIERIRADNSIRAVVLRINSPGGTVTGSDYMLHHLKKLRDERGLPMVVSMGSMAASGGYYVAMAVGDQERSIFAEPTTTTGSIGVIIPHYDLSGLMARFDLKDDSIASHPRKQMLSMTRPIPEENRKLLEGYVNESFERFKSIVKEGRPAYRKDEDQLTDLATGEIFSATRALDLGLVDQIGFIEKAITRAAEIAQIAPDQTRVVYYHRPSFTLSDFAGLAQSRQASELETLFELTTPRAYFLASSFPPLLSQRDLYREP